MQRTKNNPNQRTRTRVSGARKLLGLDVEANRSIDLACCCAGPRDGEWHASVDRFGLISSGGASIWGVAVLQTPTPRHPLARSQNGDVRRRRVHITARRSMTENDRRARPLQNVPAAAASIERQPRPSRIEGQAPAGSVRGPGAAAAGGNRRPAPCGSPQLNLNLTPSDHTPPPSQNPKPQGPSKTGAAAGRGDTPQPQPTKQPWRPALVRACLGFRGRDVGPSRPEMGGRGAVEQNDGCCCYAASPLLPVVRQ